MSLTFQALCYLHAFEQKLPLSNGVLLESQLRTCRLDYSIQSLARIDAFLDTVRHSKRLHRDTYLDDPAAQNLLYLLNFYVGEVIGRYLQSPPHWYDYEAVKAIDPLAEYSGEAFENSVTVGFPDHPIAKSKPWFRPMLSILSRLFDEAPDKSVLFSAGFLLPQAATTGPDAQRPLPPLPTPAWPVDVAAHFRQSPQSQADLTPAPPAWLPGDQLQRLFNYAPSLLREGRVVLGAVVQANTRLSRQDLDDGAPGEVLYDPQGRVPAADLEALALSIFALKGQKPNDPALTTISDHLTNEKTRAFGLAVPPSYVPYPLSLSTTYFERKQLPGNRLAQTIVPLLISDTRPGLVLPLPSRFWPIDFSAQWNNTLQAQVASAAARGDHLAAYVPDPALAHLKPMSVAEEGLLWLRQKDYVRARTAWERAVAATNNAGALNGLGQLYEEGLGVAKDHARALRYYEQSAAQGYSTAQQAIARIRGVTEPNEKSANHGLKRAVLQVDIDVWTREAIDGFKSRKPEAVIRQTLAGAGCTPHYLEEIVDEARHKVGFLRRMEGVALIGGGSVLLYPTWQIAGLARDNPVGHPALLIGLLGSGLLAFGVYKLVSGERGYA